MILSFEELYRAYKSCQKSKANSISAIEFEVNLIDNLWKLHYEINSKTYTPSRYISFLANSPKMREIFAPSFRDRVVHHLLVNDLEPIFEPTFIYDSYSCRKGKGIHTAVKRVQKFARRERNRYYLQLDIRNFFLSIKKRFLYELLEDEISRKVSDEILKERTLYLSKETIFTDPTENYLFKGSRKGYKDLPKHKSLFYTSKERGLPIGNLTSQFFGNVYLNPLDQYVKRVLKGDYVRYVDDFILFGSSKEELEEKKRSIEFVVENNLGLKLKEQFRLRKVESGIDFLGYITFPTHILVRKRVVNNFKYKLAKFIESEKSGDEVRKWIEQKASYFGHFKHADSYRLQKKYWK
jgi:retron-type reverse transcriptase